MKLGKKAKIDWASLATEWSGFWVIAPLAEHPRDTWERFKESRPEFTKSRKDMTYSEFVEKIGEDISKTEPLTSYEYIVSLVDESRNVTIINKALTDRQGLDDILRHMVGLRPPQRLNFFKTLDVELNITRTANPEATKPFTIFVNKAG